MACVGRMVRARKSETEHHTEEQEGASSLFVMAPQEFQCVMYSVYILFSYESEGENICELV